MTGKRIAVSAEFIRPRRVGGMEHALHYLIDGLADALAADDELLVFGEVMDPLPGAQVRVVPSPSPRSNRFFQEARTIRKHGADTNAWFFPNYHTPRGKFDCRVVTLIPDLQYRWYPENFSPQKRLWQRWAHGRTLTRADHVLAPSSFVRDDVLERYGARWEDKISVLPLPVSWDRFGGHTRGGTGRRPYILTVAAHYAHKNLSTLIRAFREVHRQEPEVGLVLAGQTRENLIGVRQAEDVSSLIESSGLQHVVRSTGYISDEELGALYRGAELFVLPSLFEGFGLPAVEALGFGLPVITTDRTSLPEVTRGLARYLEDPLDADEMAAEILTVLGSAEAARIPAARALELRSYYEPARLGQELYRVLLG